ncbi:MAG: DMT family transporter [Bryobacteraceae bacterium]|nr:DMT family transporter [Bryobacteraceae bacterium]
MTWFAPALLAAFLWGLVGVLQKLGSNRIGAGSLLIWVTAGYVLALPLLLLHGGFGGFTWRGGLVGVAAGLINGLGTWFLFASLERGAKASVAIPLTALYPVVTFGLAFGLLSERLTGREWLGVALAVTGAAMLSYERDGS